MVEGGKKKITGAVREETVLRLAVGPDENFFFAPEPEPDAGAAPASGTEGAEQKKLALLCRDCVGSWARRADEAGAHGWPLAAAAGGNPFLAWYHRTSAPSHMRARGEPAEPADSVLERDARVLAGGYEEPLFAGWHTNTYTFLNLNHSDVGGSGAGAGAELVRKLGAVSALGVAGSATYDAAKNEQNLQALPVLSLDPLAHLAHASSDGLFAGQWGAHDKTNGPGAARARGPPASAHNCSSAEGTAVRGSGFCRADAKFATYQHDAAGEQV